MFVVDAGSGGSRNLGRMGFSTGSIGAVFLTHFHSDHIDGLGELSMTRWVTGTHKEALPVFGPTGVESVVEGFNHAYGQDAVYRHAHHGDSVAALSGNGMSAKSFDVPKDGTKVTVYDQGGVTVEMFSVDHKPISPAVGYLFTYKGRTALVSGDTTKNANVELFSKNIDLLIHEALSPQLLTIMSESADAAGNSSGSQILHDVLDYHTSPVEAAEIAVTPRLSICFIIILCHPWIFLVLRPCGSKGSMRSLPITHLGKMVPSYRSRLIQPRLLMLNLEYKYKLLFYIV